MPSTPVTTSDASLGCGRTRRLPVAPATGPDPPACSGMLFFSWATTASACAAVIVPSSTSGCRASRRRVPGRRPSSCRRAPVAVSSPQASSHPGSCRRSARRRSAIPRSTTRARRTRIRLPCRRPARPRGRSPGLVQERLRGRLVRVARDLQLVVVVHRRLLSSRELIGRSVGVSRASAPPTHQTRARQEQGENGGKKSTGSTGHCGQRSRSATGRW